MKFDETTTTNTNTYTTTSSSIRMTSKSNIKSERGSHTSGCDEWSEDVTETEKQPQQPQELSDSKDNKRILLSKLLLFFVMVGSAAGLAALTHSFATRIERSKFENQVRG